MSLDLRAKVCLWPVSASVHNIKIILILYDGPLEMAGICMILTADESPVIFGEG
jgi:hypothetical protein